MSEHPAIVPSAPEAHRVGIASRWGVSSRDWRSHAVDVNAEHVPRDRPPDPCRRPGRGPAASARRPAAVSHSVGSWPSTLSALGATPQERGE